ncbi:tetratricopeptide repeat protein [Asanoa ishikariensis]|uniref:tetratricopeptide repeat protein n=1 Tax=Asanoa ishikariensis TaxID=137265 RepID=UPI0035715478
MLDGLGRDDEAEQLIQEALEVFERIADHHEVAVCLHNLGSIYHRRAEPARAEPLYRRALAIKERALGPDHPELATTLTNLGTLCEQRGRAAEALVFYGRAISVLEGVVEDDHPTLTVCREQQAALSTRE